MQFLEDRWIEEFLENDYVSNENDLLLKKMIVQNLNRRLVKKIIFTLQMSFEIFSLKSLFQIIYIRKKYNISLTL